MSTNNTNAFAPSQLELELEFDGFSTTAFNGDLHGWDEDDSCCFNFPDATEAAELETERMLNFVAAKPPFFTRSTTVSASRKKIAQGIKDFDAIFNAPAVKA